MAFQLEGLELPLSVKDGITSAIKGIAGLVAGFTAAAGLAISLTFKWADELDSIQDIMGVTSKQAAALNFVLRKSRVATTTLTKGMTILEKGLVKADGSLDLMGKSLKDYGINVFDANGALKDQTTLIQDISQKYNSFSTQQERVNFLTATFGKSGAELIDFFDTLAQEGGIDAVTKKVEAFSLAIDPNRYEQFTRSLEELKLIGLGLAVAFTERVMPVFEKLLGILTDPNLTTPEKLAAIATAVDKFVAALINTLTKKITEWTNSAGPTELAIKFIKWIEGIGQSSPGTPSSETVAAIQGLVTAIARALAQVPWDAVGTAFQDKINQELAKINISDEAKTNLIFLGGSMAALLVFGLAGKLALLPIAAIGTWFSTTFIATALSTMATGVTLIWAVIQTLFFLIAGLVGHLAAGFMVLSAAFGVTAGVMFAAILLVGTAIAMLIIHWDDLKTAMKFLTDPEVPWSTKWKLIGDSFKDVVGGAINFVIGLVNNLIEAITGVGDTLGTIDLGNLSDNPGRNVTGGNTSSGSGGGNNHRASGGPVIAGQSYIVGEYKPEVFKSNQSGRIEQVKDMQPKLEIDYAKMGLALRDALLTSGALG